MLLLITDIKKNPRVDHLKLSPAFIPLWLTVFWSAAFGKLYPANVGANLIYIALWTNIHCGAL